MRINVAVPERHVSAPILNSALESVTRLNESLLRHGDAPPFRRSAPGVQWRPEPPGQGEHFDHAALVGRRGWGDCDDLAPWHAATLRVSGRDRGARAIVRRSGPSRWHAVVRRSDGRIEDPSADAGMHEYRRARHGVRGGAVQYPMTPGVVGGAYEARPVLAVRPIVSPSDSSIESWQARADLPWHPSEVVSPVDVAMVSLHSSPLPDQALVGCLEGAILLGESEQADEDHLDSMRCLSDMLQGASWGDCAREYGVEHASRASSVVGAFFKKARRKLRRGLKRAGKTALRAARGITRDVVLPLAPMAANMIPIPGVGPVASMALQAATPALQQALARESHLPPPALSAVVPGLLQSIRAMPGVPAMPGMPGVPGDIPLQAFAAFL